MPKIVRYNGNLKAFASEQQANERTLFGQAAIANDLTSQITAQFLRGWGIVGPSDQPSLQDFNAAMYTNGQLIAYLHQMGIAEYNAAQEYFIGSITQAGGEIYISLTNGNVGNAPASSPAQWLAIGGATKANASTTITAGLGLLGGGDLSGNRTISAKFGTTAGTVMEGNDPRIAGAAQKSANLSDLTNAATARGNLGLGSAATKAVQSSATDTTDGALMAVGAFGIGALNAPFLVNLDQTITPNGLYYINTETLGNLPATYGMVLIENYPPIGNISQTVTVPGNLGGNTRYFRTYNVNTSTWNAWVDLYHSGNLPVTTFAKTLLDDANAAAARATLDVYSKAEANGIANGIAIGVGQTWQNVTGSRSFGTTYTNTTGRPIQIFVGGDLSGSTITIGGVSMAFQDYNGGAFLNHIIPAGQTYSVSIGGAGTDKVWAELR